jgi:polyisoprenoid-binding protein YceI
MQAQQQSESRTVWSLDREHSTVEFAVKKLFLFTVKGRLTNLSGSLVLDEKTISKSSVSVTIRASSIDTGNKDRDAHLRSSSFLNANENPDIQFQSTEVGPGRDRDTLIVKGSLTVRDKTREVMLDVTEVDRSKSPNGTEVIYYVAETELDRHAFGVSGWRGVVASKLKVVINVQANREL